MWLRIILIAIISTFLTACQSGKEQPPADSASSICQILRGQLEEQVYKDYDENTMKRKNPADQAKLMQEYNSYECPEITGPLD